MTRTAYVGLGSNLGDRALFLMRATAAIRSRLALSNMRCSRVFESAPLGGPAQGPYLNAVVAGDTELSAHDVLQTLLAIEADLGRERRERWGPRVIDLDLLMLGNEIHDGGVRVPHPELHRRRFVLEPLAEVEPDLVHPILGLGIAQLLRDCEDITPLSEKGIHLC